MFRRKQKPGYHKGHHFTTYVEEVKQLKRSGKLEKAKALLLELVKATEEESKAHAHWGVAPWYYEQLAIIYRGAKDYASEIAILERFVNQSDVPGILSSDVSSASKKLLHRLDRARALAKKADER